MADSLDLHEDDFQHPVEKFPALLLAFKRGKLSHEQVVGFVREVMPNATPEQLEEFCDQLVLWCLDTLGGLDDG